MHTRTYIYYIYMYIYTCIAGYVYLATPLNKESQKAFHNSGINPYHWSHTSMPSCPQLRYMVKLD
jgi:hypothetical protein